MEIHQDQQGLISSLKGIVHPRDHAVVIEDEAKLQRLAMDKLIYNAVFASDEVRATARWLIWEIGQELGIRPASINDLYCWRGRCETDAEWTVPAMNLRGMAYDMGRAVFQAALSRGVGAMIFEIARSEVGYTDQSPAEYASVILAAAIREGYRQPLFIQGDQFQVNPERFTGRLETEIDALKDLIEESIQAGFYNIHIDTSTLVDLDRATVTEQQRRNFELSSRFTKVIRGLEPEGCTISLGGQIGSIGGKNSTSEELRRYMDGYNDELPAHMVGLSKISIQTGTSVGGVVLPDGSLAQAKIDFDVLRRLSNIARDEYGMGGAVQHGASTLPEEAFHKFPEEGCLEIHLATGFQNIVYEHPAFPDDLRERMYTYLREDHAHHWKEHQTEEQFIYYNRKRALGPFKRHVWDISAERRGEIRAALQEKFTFLFEQLSVVDTEELIERHVCAPGFHKALSDFGVTEQKTTDIGLAD